MISGGSVAGPALALWLHRYGFEPTIVERAPAPRPGGYAVDFRGAAMVALDRMGILDKLRTKATNMGAMTYVDGKGRKIASLDPVAFSGELEVLRGDLVEILYAETKDTTEYLFDDTITAIDEGPDGVDVTFAHAEPRRFDLVVGADGVHSKVRSLVFGEESRFAEHLGLHVAVCTIDNYLGLDHAGRFRNTPGRVAGVYSAQDNTEAKAMFYFASEKLDYDRHDQEQLRALVAEAFADGDWEVPELLARMPQAPDLYFDTISQIHLDQPYRGRVALVGDAGYCASPLSGMGTSLALVGAYVLAGELAEADGDHTVAFARYAAELAPFVAACKKQAHDDGKWFVPRTAWGLRLRNLNYRLMAKLPTGKLVEKLALKVANVITLRDYARTRPAAQPDRGAR